MNATVSYEDLIHRYLGVFTRDGVEKQRLGRLNLQSLMLLTRKIAWRIFHGPLGGIQSALQKIW